MPVSFSNTPLVDDANPLYCPQLTARDYLTLASNDQLPSSNNGGVRFMPFQARLSMSISREVAVRRDQISEVMAGHAFSDADADVPILHINHRTATPFQRMAALPRDTTTDTSFSSINLQLPARRARSNLGEDDESFILSAKANKLHLFRTLDPDSSFGPIKPLRLDKTDTSATARKPKDGQKSHDANEGLRVKCAKLEEELHGVHPGSETVQDIRKLLIRIERALSGSRLRQHFTRVERPTHQVIVDYLASKGYLTAPILELFRRANIRYLNLTESINEESGLNLGGRDLLRVFTKPNSFLQLSRISLSHATLYEFDVTLFHHLPALAWLDLDDTGVGIEAIMHLSALKKTLKYLNLNDNCNIEDDAIPCLAVLTALQTLRVSNTSLTVDGIRALATVTADLSRSIAMEVPRSCVEYLSRINRLYNVQPSPPLITDPSAVRSLTATALRRNLMAHASYNTSVMIEGDLETMYEALEDVLELRRRDIFMHQAMALFEQQGGEK